MDAWRNCKDQSDTVSSCRLSCCIPRPVHRDWALKHYGSQGSSWGAQVCKAEQVILRQIQVMSFLLPLQSGTIWMLQGSKHCLAASSTGLQSLLEANLQAAVPFQHFFAGIWFLHDRDQFLLGENSLGASHPEEVLQLQASQVLQLPCPQVHISQGHPQQHLQLQLGNSPKQGHILPRVMEPGTKLCHITQATSNQPHCNQSIPQQWGRRR